MTPPSEEKDGEKYDERLLVLYLLGALSREETERLDELSIVDDDFACRLITAENDLVDSYARKELSPADAERFTAVYLSSPRRRQKLEFAETLLDFKPARAQTAETPAAPAREMPSLPVTEPPRKRFSLGWGPKLAFAGISLALLLTAGYLLRENFALRNSMNGARTQQGAIEQHQRQLEQELNEQRAANNDIEKQLQQAQSSQPNLNQLKTVAMLLPPLMRGATRIPTLTIARGTDLAVISLTLEADDFPAYQAALKDPSSSRVLWQSGTLESSSAGEHKAISMSFPAALLKQQMYIVELTGIPAQKKPENVAAYSFRAILK